MFYLYIFNIINNMKFILVGPGCAPIPPKGWGAVESIVWDYYLELTAQGHEVVIVNQYMDDDIIRECNRHDGIVHIMYDDHITIVPKLRSKKILYTSHYAYITHPLFETITPYYKTIFQKVIEYQSYLTLYVLSKEIQEVYQKYGFTGKSVVLRNGARTFHTTDDPSKGHRSIYVGKIELRKRQYKYQSISCIDFVGNYHDSPLQSTNYVGEWNKQTLYQNLTEYGNLILLSDAEADPLVIKEALMAGLGIVISQCSTANLDLTKEFITVIPNDRLEDIEFIQASIEKNRAFSLKNREAILAYAKHFSWNTIVKEYVSSLAKIVLVGPGIMTIPPPGWGAVEILLWDYYQELKRQGHDVILVNKVRNSPTDQMPDTLYSRALIDEINAHQADIVHIHYDCLHYIIPFLKSRVYITSHYPYIGNTEQYGAYNAIFHAMCKNETHSICAISKKDYEVFKAFALHPEKVFYTPNGSSPIPPLTRPGIYAEKSIYIAKIEPRKKQHVYCCLPNLDFYGKCDDSFRFCPSYKGEKDHDELLLLLREYGSLVLLSDGESDPLVIKEALMAGIPVVTNIHSGMTEMPFIDIIPEDKLMDMSYIQCVLEKSRQKDRTGIREYASQFEWKKVVKEYVATIV
jgi:glycosyltransferase involved in cell wall biosynthesis